MKWTSELDERLRQWDRDGVTNREARRILEAEGYAFTNNDISARRTKLGISKTIFVWDQHPEAQEFFDKHWGYRTAIWMAKQMRAMGYDVTPVKIRNRAKRLQVTSGAPADDLCFTDAARVLGLRYDSTVRKIAIKLRLRRYGRGRATFLDKRAVECVCVYLGKELPWPREKRSSLVGSEVAAAINLRVEPLRGRPDMLVPHARIGQVAFARWQLVGTVVAEGVSHLDVRTRYGMVRVPVGLVEVYREAEVLINA